MLTTLLQPDHSIRPASHERRETGLPKILFFYPDLGAMGGIERYIHQVGLMLKDRHAFQPVVVCSEGTPFFHRLKADGLRVHGVRSNPLLSRPALRGLDKSLWGQVRRIVATEQPALVHVHIGQNENLRFRHWGFPTVYTFHGYGPLYSLEATKNPIKRLYKRLSQPRFRRMIDDLDAFMIVSHTERDRLLTEGYLHSADTATVIHNGLCPGQWALPENRNIPGDLNLPPKARLVSFINRLDHNKNPLLFVEMAEELTLRGNIEDHVYFLIAGDGPLTQAVRNRIAASSARNRIRYAGYRADARELIAASEAVVHVSSMEGFGLGILEAMALETPCVAFANGAIPEILDIPEARPLLVTPGDLGALVRRVEALLKSPAADRKKLTEALRLRATEFDLNITVDKLEGVYRRVLHLD